ncbi:MAG: hypothetical protein SOS22_01290 [Absicoccus sp.]|uniref:hypothetical protein n=1 Tax=Absicoccus sp. TaxID=2718527 RepID=UPI002A74ED01|nr:hypothetical protein [Absicoccus sp.]MDY3034838.1 hypothetical protein [Absicoccus sp.]
MKLTDSTKCFMKIHGIGKFQVFKCNIGYCYGHEYFFNDTYELRKVSESSMCGYDWPEYGEIGTIVARQEMIEVTEMFAN